MQLLISFFTTKKSEGAYATVYFVGRNSKAKISKLILTQIRLKNWSFAVTMGSGQAVRRLPLEQEIEGSNPSSPANKKYQSLPRVFFICLVARVETQGSVYEERGAKAKFAWAFTEHRSEKASATILQPQPRIYE